MTARERCDVVVVGAGMGGLMAGALLARRGREVFVVEAADRIGGYQCRIESRGFAIEPHFHFLQDAGPGRPVRRLLEELGIQLEWRQVDPLVEYHFPDRHFTMPVERAEFIDELKHEFPAQALGIDRLFATTKAIQRAAERLPELAPVLVRHGGDTVEDLLSRFISDRELKAIAGGWAGYFGYRADEISGLAIAVFTESCFDGGVLHPVGGITALASALRATIESRGGSVLLSSPLQSIQVDGGRATGVVVQGGERIAAQAVISNVDPFTTFGALGSRDETVGRLLQRLESIDRFRSPFSVALAVRASPLRLDERSPVHVVFPGNDMDEPAVSIGIPTLLNPELAEPGHHVVLLYTFVSRERIEALLADDAQAQRLAHQLIAAAEAGLPGLREAMVSMTVSTSALPSVYSQATAGALGWAPTPSALLGSEAAAKVLRHKWLGPASARFARIAPRLVTRLAERSPVPATTTPVPGLFLAGQWTRTGAGMNNVFASAAAAADAVESARR